MDCSAGLLLALVGLPNRGTLKIRRHVKISHRVRSRRVFKVVTFDSPIADLFLVVDVKDAKAKKQTVQCQASRFRIRPVEQPAWVGLALVHCY
jgi:hypothetical protein